MSVVQNEREMWLPCMCRYSHQWGNRAVVSLAASQNGGKQHTATQRGESQALLGQYSQVPTAHSAHTAFGLLDSLWGQGEAGGQYPAPGLQDT